MNNRLLNTIAAFAAPIATILGGVILLFCPDLATALLAKTMGWGFLIAGVVLAVSAITGRQGLNAGLRAALFIGAGVWLTKKPMSLAVAFGKLLGIGLILGAISGYRRSGSSAGRTIYLAEGLLGLVLLAAPLSASRLVYTVIGLILVAAGITMLVNKLRNHDRLGPGRDDIIDAL